MSSQTPGYKKTLPQTVLDILEASFGKSVFTTYREGDPIVFPKSMLPAIFVSEPRTHYDLGPSGHDEIIHEILVQVVFDKRSEFGNPDLAATLDRKIETMIQGVDSTTGELSSVSVLGALRKNLSMSNLVISNEVDVEKGVVPRSDELDTMEGQITIRVAEIRAVSGRS